MQAVIRAIEYYLPEQVLSNQDLAAEFPEWTAEKILAKTGISERRIARVDECSSDVAVEAAQRIFATGVTRAEDIDYLIICTQAPDYFLPTTACLVQDRLGMPTTTGGIDINLGCSGYVYGLSLAQGLIATGQAQRVLFITTGTYSKFMHPQDKSVRALFGDAAAATLIEAVADDVDRQVAYVFGTDGKGAGDIIVPAGGLRRPCSPETGVVECDADGNYRSANNLYMNGAEVFTFTLRVVPGCVNRLLQRSGKQLDEIDRFFFHQANGYALEHLRKKLRIPAEKFYMWLQHCGNTSASSIPIALKHAVCEGQLRAGQLAALVGFGVGYSWAATLVEWPYLGYATR